MDLYHHGFYWRLNMARLLNNNELSKIGGGLIQVDRDDTISTSGSTSYLMGSPTIDQLARQTGLKNQLAGVNYSAQFGTAPGVAPGSSGTDYRNHIADIAPSFADDSDGAIMQLAHELGHILHPQDQYPQHYLSQHSYINAQMTGEGWAQLNAIKTSQTMAVLGQNAAIPGDQDHVEREVQTYVTMHGQGYSDGEIAAQIGSEMWDQMIGGNQTYSQFWGNYYYDSMYDFSSSPQASSGMGFYDPDWRYRS